MNVFYLIPFFSYQSRGPHSPSARAGFQEKVRHWEEIPFVPRVSSQQGCYLFKSPRFLTFQPRAPCPHKRTRMIILFSLSEPHCSAKKLLLEHNWPHNLFLLAFKFFLFLFYVIFNYLLCNEIPVNPSNSQSPNICVGQNLNQSLLITLDTQMLPLIVF